METQSVDSSSPTEPLEGDSSHSPSPGPGEGFANDQQACNHPESREPSDTHSSSSTPRPAPNEQLSAPIEKEGRKRLSTSVQDQWQRFRAFLASTWAWELCGICLSISCMTAIIATLPNFNGHPLSDWNFVLSPNTLVSTFITISKTSMLLVVIEGISQLKWSYFLTDAHFISELQHFDAASRGPWGSLAFLFDAKRGAKVASFGALITIAALAMDPFGQQIVSFETRYVPRNNLRATIPVAHHYMLPLDHPVGKSIRNQLFETTQMKHHADAFAHVRRGMGCERRNSQRFLQLRSLSPCSLPK